MQLTSSDRPEKTERTAGERWFDKTVYGGIGYVANVLISIGALWAADRTKGGKKLIDSTAHSLSGLTGIKHETMRSQVRFTALLSGGWSVLVPIKLLEDNKADIIKNYDEHYYANTPDAQAYLEQAHSRLDSAPQQTWFSVIGSRLLSMVPFYAFTGTAMKEGQWLARVTNGKLYGEKLITKASRGIDGLLNSTDAKALAELAEKNCLYPNQTVNNTQTGVFERPKTALADYTITESITSAITAIALYGFTRLTAPLLGKKIDPEELHFSPVAPIGTFTLQSPIASMPEKSEVSAKPKQHIQLDSLTSEAVLQPTARTLTP